MSKIRTQLFERKYNKYAKIDIEKYISECDDLEEDADLEISSDGNIGHTENSCSANNDDINNLEFKGNIISIVRERTDTISHEEFCAQMRTTNLEQRDFLLTLLEVLIDKERKTQVFFTGVAGSGKTFTLNLVK